MRHNRRLAGVRDKCHRPWADDLADCFHDAGCDDALIGFQRGVIVAQFAREAGTLRDAIESALDAMREAGATVLRVEPDHLVTLGDIAERSGLTHQAVALFVNSERGAGFPPLVACVASDHPLYEWRDVARWLSAS